MGFKIKRSEFISSTGLQAKDAVSEIEFGGFNNATKEIIIQWKITSNTGQVIGVFPQKIAFDFKNPVMADLLVKVSDALHDLAMNEPCFLTPDGLKSFADFNAETIDVGMPGE